MPLGLQGGLELKLPGSMSLVLALEPGRGNAASQAEPRKSAGQGFLSSENSEGSSRRAPSLGVPDVDFRLPGASEDDVHKSKAEVWSMLTIVTRTLAYVACVIRWHDPCSQSSDKTSPVAVEEVDCHRCPCAEIASWNGRAPIKLKVKIVASQPSQGHGGHGWYVFLLPIAGGSVAARRLSWRKLGFSASDTDVPGLGCESWPKNWRQVWGRCCTALLFDFQGQHVANHHCRCNRRAAASLQPAVFLHDARQDFGGPRQL